MNAMQFLRTLPARVSPESIKDSNTCFHFDLSGEGGGQLTIWIENGIIEVLDGLHHAPKCVVNAKAENFMKVVNKELNPLMALLTGKVRVSDQRELTKYARVFGLMK